MKNQFNLATGQTDEYAVSLLAARMQGLGEDDWTALKHLNVLHRFVGRNRSIVKDGEHLSFVRVLCKGWAIRVVELDNERRQVLDFVLPGDVIGLHMDGRQVSTCLVIALTACELGELELCELEQVARRNPAIGAGLRHHLTREMSQANDQVVRLGRMTAYERVCSFLLDIYLRQQMRSPGSITVDFPIKQSVVADALGLSVVHINRQVMQLRREGLISLSRKQLIVHDTNKLAAMCRYRTRRFDPSPLMSLEAAE